MTEQGKKILDEYLCCIRFIEGGIGRHCSVSEETAFQDALNTVCAISEESRRAILNHLGRRRAS